MGVEVQILIGWLEVRFCFAAAASSWGIHILGYQVNAGLKVLKALCGAVACCQNDVGHVLNDVADSVLEPLQLHLMCRL